MASHRAAGRQSYVYGTAARDMAAEGNAQENGEWCSTARI